MHTSTEDNINISLNGMIPHNARYRLNYKVIPGQTTHKKHVLEYTTDGESFNDVLMYKDDTVQTLPAFFCSTRKARRFLKKILLSQGKTLEEIETLTVMEQISTQRTNSNEIC
jgi:hypothetical protein